MVYLASNFLATFSSYHLYLVLPVSCTLLPLVSISSTCRLSLLRTKYSAVYSSALYALHLFCVFLGSLLSLQTEAIVACNDADADADDRLFSRRPLTCPRSFDQTRTLVPPFTQLPLSAAERRSIARYSFPFASVANRQNTRARTHTHTHTHKHTDIHGSATYNDGHIQQQ